MLAVRDGDKKITWKSYHKKLLYTTFLWVSDRQCISLDRQRTVQSIDQ